MDINTLSSTTSRLLQSLEQLGTSQGAELKSSGPSGEPSQELVKEFENALQNEEIDQTETISLEKNAHTPQDLLTTENSFFQIPKTEKILAQNPDSLIIQKEKNPSVISMETIEYDIPMPTPFTFEPSPVQATNTTQDFSVKNTAEVENNNTIQVLSPENIPSDTINPDNLKLDALKPETLKPETLKPKTLSPENLQPNTLNPVDQNTSPTNKEMGTQDYLNELQDIMNELSQNNITPQLLYRAQYIASMFSIHASTGSKVSQQAEQGLESILKQQ